MDNEIKAWLYDILNAIDEIDDFFGEAPKMFQEFEKDIRTKRAVERNIEIIGEAMGRILRKNENINISNSRRIVDTRNRIIHGYDNVSDDILWAIVIRYLPILKQEISVLLIDLEK